MKLALLGMKGGVGKTTLAMHLAQYLSDLGPTLVIDGDRNRSALKWAERHGGKGLPFVVVSEMGLVKIKNLSSYVHWVIDTQARPEAEDIQTLVEVVDFFLLPTLANGVSLGPLVDTVKALRKVGVTEQQFAIVLNQVPAPPVTVGTEARALLESLNWPTLSCQIGNRIAFSHAGTNGVTVKEMKTVGAQQGWQEISQLGFEICERVAPAQAKKEVA